MTNNHTPHSFTKRCKASVALSSPADKSKLRSTAKPITPFGGLVSLIGFFERIGLAQRISESMPFT